MKTDAVILLAFLVGLSEASEETAVALGVQWPVCNPEVVSWHSHPNYCTKYIICYYGNLVIMPCAPDFHFNPVTKQCMEPEKAKCDIKYACPNKDDELNPVFLPNPDDCSSYFICYKGNPIGKDCAENKWWDVLNNWCTYPDKVTCDPRTPNNPNDTDSETIKRKWRSEW
jgi:hypothetical protein